MLSFARSFILIYHVGIFGKLVKKNIVKERENDKKKNIGRHSNKVTSLILQ